MSSDALLQTIDTLTHDVVQRDLTIKALRQDEYFFGLRIDYAKDDSI